MADAVQAVTQTAIQNASSAAPLTAADGTPLNVALARATRRSRIRAFLLVAPLLLFIITTFAIPIGQMLYRSVFNDAFSANMPNLVNYFSEQQLNGEVPDENGFAALVEDLREARKAKTIGRVGTRINYELPGARSQFTSGARKAKRLEPPYKQAMADLDKDWLDPNLWAVMERAADPTGIGFYLAALDMEYDTSGEIVRSVGISHCPSTGNLTIALLQPVDDICPTTFLDIAACAHYCMDCLAPKPRCAKRLDGRLGNTVRC